jgi:hypothetical protein
MELGYDLKGVVRIGTRNWICPNRILVLVIGNKKKCVCILVPVNPELIFQILFPEPENGFDRISGRKKSEIIVQKHYSKILLFQLYPVKFLACTRIPSIRSGSY